ADTDMSWSKRYSGIEMMKKSKGDGALFCAAGYKPSGGDCVKEDAAGYCQTPPEDKLCSGYDKAWYLGHRNQLIIPADMKSGSNCYQYYCRDERMGFRSATDHTCVQCDEVRSGRAADGTCFATCDYGQSYRVADYYKDGQCKKDVEYTKNDMMYGKGKTENSSTFDTACWPKREAALYRQCVPQGGGKALIFRNILNLEVKQILKTSNAVNASVVLK
ncbi:MAG: hypothetical protein K5912_01700, partial [Alphaproteobacteria bacterium]|nr:hypothetical protein [Alphaproteobacteria bacterium]